MSTVELKNGTLVADYTSPYIIAEVNSSHNGNLNIARQMIDAAVDAGCDCVKFQSWTSDTLYSKSYYDENPLAKRFVDKFSMSEESLRQMAMYCCEKRIDFASTPYSNEETDFLVRECNVPFIKVSSMEVNNPKYIEYIASKQVPIILSTGMSSYEEVAEAVRIIESVGNKHVILLHCVTIYPTPLEYANIKNMIKLRELFPEYPVGFSDHTMGDTAAIIASALGAAVIEKHITLDAKKIGMDNQMAMEPDDLKCLVEKCKSVRSALGSETRILFPDEVKQKKIMRRSIVAKHDLKAGTVLMEEDLIAKRPGTGFAPTEIHKLVGRKLIKNVDADIIITESDLSN